jgi:hypothetical protein
MWHRWGNEKYKILVGKLPGKRATVRHKRRWDDNIKVDLKERFDDVNWIHLAQCSLQWRDFVKTEIKFGVLFKARNCLAR